MKQEKYNFEFRERYLAKQLSEEDREAYELDLAEDADLMKELKRHIHFTQAVGEYVEMPKESPLSAVKPPQDKPRWMPRAATVLLLLGLAAIWWYVRDEDTKPPTPPVAQIYASYFQAMPTALEVETVVRRWEIAGIENAADTSQLYRAFQYFEQAQYENAAMAFEDLIEAGRDSTGSILFYLAQAELELGNGPAAIEHFDLYLQQYDKYEEDATWYLALAHLRENALEPARGLLLEIAQSKGLYQSKAREILEQLSVD